MVRSREWFKRNVLTVFELFADSHELRIGGKKREKI